MIWNLVRKEIKDAFGSPMIFVLAGIFCLIVGWPFFNYIVLSKETTKMGLTYSVLRPIFGNMNFIFLFLCPLITMRSFAEEKKQHTLDLLLQSRLSQTDIILGKLISSLAVAFFMLVLTLIFPLVLAMAGYNDWGTVISNYLGLVFCIVCYTMVGIFTSSLTDNQIVAALLSFCILFVSMLLVLSANATNNYMVGQIFLYLSIPFHYQTFAFGMVKSYNMVYLLSFAFFFFHLTRQSLESRRW